MMLNGGKIKDSPIQLFLSSRAEMQKVIEQARARALAIMAGNAAPSTPAAPTIQPPVITPPTIAMPTVAAATTQNVIPQPPVITMSNFLNTMNRPAQTVPTPNTIEIPGLGYTTAGASLLFNPNLPTNMASIIDPNAKPMIVIDKYAPVDDKSSSRRRSRRSESDSDDSRSRSRSLSPRNNRDRKRSRSPRRDSRRGGRDRYRRSRSRSRDRERRRQRSNSRERKRSSSDRDWDADEANASPIYSSNLRGDELTKLQQLHTNERVDAFGRRIPEPGRDVFGREIRSNRDEEPNGCIKLSGLDKNTGYGELRREFSGKYITNNGIKMINDEHGERTGEAYLRFARMEDKRDALRRGAVNIRGCRVTINDATDAEYEGAIDAFKPNVRREDRRSFSPDEDVEPVFTCLRLYDMPPYAKEQDIIKVFSNYSLMHVCIGRNSSKKMWESYVKFYRPEDAKSALRDVPNFRLQHKYVTVSRCTDLEFEAARNEFEVDMQLRMKDDSNKGSENNKNATNEGETIILFIKLSPTLGEKLLNKARVGLVDSSLAWCKKNRSKFY